MAPHRRVRDSALPGRGSSTWSRHRRDQPGTPSPRSLPGRSWHDRPEGRVAGRLGVFSCPSRISSARTRRRSDDRAGTRAAPHRIEALPTADAPTVPPSASCAPGASVGRSGRSRRRCQPCSQLPRPVLERSRSLGIGIVDNQGRGGLAQADQAERSPGWLEAARPVGSPFPKAVPSRRSATELPGRHENRSERSSRCWRPDRDGGSLQPTKKLGRERARCEQLKADRRHRQRNGGP